MYSGGPTLLGFNVFWVATMFAAVAVIAMIFALYTVMTVRDPSIEGTGLGFAVMVPVTVFALSTLLI